jgi:hypothetical protein
MSLIKGLDSLIPYMALTLGCFVEMEAEHKAFFHEKIFSMADNSVFSFEIHAEASLNF